MARQKPFLTLATRQKRLRFAEIYLHWTPDDWSRIVWTDERSFNIGGAHGTIWVTRKPGEEYLEDCLVPKFKKLGSLMVWGAIFWTKANGCMG